MPDRISYQRSNGELEIRIATRKNWLVFSFFALLTLGWIWAAITSVYHFLTGGQISLTANYLFLWMLFGAGILYITMALYFGQEVIRINKEMLTIKYEVLGWGITSRLQTEKIISLRLFQPKVSSLSLEFSLRNWGLSGGLVAVEYREHVGKKTYHLGRLLDEKTAGEIINQIKQFLPEQK